MLIRPFSYSGWRCLTLALFSLAVIAGCQNEAPDVENTEAGDAVADSDSVEASGEDTRVMYSPEAFRKAAFDGKLRVVEVCLDEGLDVNEPDENGFTALAMASYNGHTQIAKLLLENGADVDSRDVEGKTPLIHASSGPFPETVKVLLDADAKIDAVDSGEHFTPLMTAAALGNVEVVKVLLDAGADKTLVDADGESAADFARSGGHETIVQLLEK
ncbi:ankyrin repeat domain-containing protein [Roseiconus nitratireducens]|uniref:Ankyrin repeat domain-containing protein n=1 Tax=Roseiconus nitratireducens TaxID=2605748 RepID=A0A5M6D4I0_9BACT|nr:ankyrin repeat domain-containing protein [Roseiconus nitratireducens]KAA5540659.1 ankyrin repeat domain-containing protein [Roseiconus nitratireducens]